MAELISGDSPSCFCGPEDYPEPPIPEPECEVVTRNITYDSNEYFAEQGYFVGGGGNYYLRREIEYDASEGRPEYWDREYGLNSLTIDVEDGAENTTDPVTSDTYSIAFDEADLFTYVATPSSGGLEDAGWTMDSNPGSNYTDLTYWDVTITLGDWVPECSFTLENEGDSLDSIIVYGADPSTPGPSVGDGETLNWPTYDSDYSSALASFTGTIDADCCEYFTRDDIDPELFGGVGSQPP